MNQRGRAGGVRRGLRCRRARLAYIWRNFNVGQIIRSDTWPIAGRCCAGVGDLRLGWLITSRPLPPRQFPAAGAPRKAPGFLGDRRGAVAALEAVTVTAGLHLPARPVVLQGGRSSALAAGQRIGLRAELQVDHLMASSAIPFVFPAVRISREYFGDGSMRAGPISPVIHLGRSASW